MSTEHVAVLIAGTGFSGIGTAIRLRQKGVTDFVMIERNADIGGTWQANTYPGCACDIPSHLYSLSYAPNPKWTRFYPRQPEIEGYLHDVVERYELRQHVRTSTELLDASWDDAAQRWEVETTNGSWTADVLISGVGGLSEPRIPEIEGVGSFDGPAFHSAQWDHSVDLTGKRVAVIGTGASAIQFVPKVVEAAAQMDLYQRTPPWILPRADLDIPRPARRLMAKVPAVRKAFRGAIYAVQEAIAVGLIKDQRLLKPLEKRSRDFLESEVSDPVLREKLQPKYRIGCKRILTSNDYFPALTKPNATVITDGVRAITPTGIVDGDGGEREYDVIIYGTGFHVTDVPLKDKVHGREGLALAEVWEPSMKAHYGITVPGFPNFFVLLGPNTGLGHNSIIYMIEAQIDYVMTALDRLRSKGAKTIEVTRPAQDRFVSEVDELSKGTVWTEGGCASWYIDKTGRNSVLWPGFTFRYRREVRSVPESDFSFEPALAPVVLTG